MFSLRHRSRLSLSRLGQSMVFSRAASMSRMPCPSRIYSFRMFPSGRSIITHRFAGIYLFSRGGCSNGRLLSSSSHGKGPRTPASPLPNPEAPEVCQARKPKPSNPDASLRSRIRRMIRLTGFRMIRKRIALVKYLPWKPPLAFVYSWSCLSGHLSFILLGASYGFSDIWDLRMMAIAAGLAMLAFNYWHPHGQPLWLPFKWNLLFIITNTGHLLYMLTEESRAKKLSPELLAVYDQVFETAGLTRVDFAKLLRKADIVNVNAEQNVCYEGALNRNVMLIIEGSADVIVHGEKVYGLQAGQFIGEMGIHVGLRLHEAMKSTATVTATTPMTVVRWPRGALIDLLESNEGIARAVQSAISADLVRKLSRQGLEAHRVHKWEHMYSVLVESVLAVKVVTNHDRNMLRRFRILHRIDDTFHRKQLERLGWTCAEYEAGALHCRKEDDEDSTDEEDKLEQEQMERLASDARPF